MQQPNPQCPYVGSVTIETENRLEKMTKNDDTFVPTALYPVPVSSNEVMVKAGVTREQPSESNQDKKQKITKNREQKMIHQ